MHTNVKSRLLCWGFFCAVAPSLAAPAAAQQRPGAMMVAAPAGAATATGPARIWFYRNYEPYGSRNYAPVALNGALAGYVPPDGSAFYRDIAPGRYHITVESGGTDVNQDKYVDLAPGQEAFVKILDSVTWDNGGDVAMYRRDTFYVSLVPPQIARAELPARPLTGG
jgi:hypothetical protein